MLKEWNRGAIPPSDDLGWKDTGEKHDRNETGDWKNLLSKTGEPNNDGKYHLSYGNNQVTKYP